MVVHIAILEIFRHIHCDATNSSMTCKVGDTCTYSSYTLVVAAGSAGSGSDFEELGAGAAAHPSSCTLH